MSGVFPTHPVLIVDDDEVWLQSLTFLLKRKAGITNVIPCSRPENVISILASREVSIVLLDFSMPRLQGDQVLSRIKSEFPDLPVILLTGSEEVETAVRCMQYGAFDYCLKTSDSERIFSRILLGIRFHETIQENRLLNSGFLNDAGPQGGAFANLWTRSFRMLRIFRYLEAVAGSSDPVLFIGEHGTGKLTLAQALHSSGKKSGDFVRCTVAKQDGSLREVLTRSNPTLLEQANGGMLYLEGVEHLSKDGEAFLSGLIDSRRYSSKGKTKEFTGRIVASVNVSLDAISAMKELLMKFSLHSVRLPALRERREDLPVLLDCFLDEASQHFGKDRPTLPTEVLTLLGTYDFPRNLHELREITFDAMRNHSSGVLSLETFKQRISVSACQPSEVSLVHFTGPRLPTLAEVQEILINEARHRASGNQGIMAQMLGISRTAVNKRLRKGVEE